MPEETVFWDQKWASYHIQSPHFTKKSTKINLNKDQVTRFNKIMSFMTKFFLLFPELLLRGKQLDFH